MRCSLSIGNLIRRVLTCIRASWEVNKNAGILIDEVGKWVNDPGKR